MFHLLAARALACLTLISALGVSAQTPTPAPTAPALNDRSGPAPYRSALEGYQPFSEEPVRSWKESNDTVGNVGGWKAYAREIQEPGAGADSRTPAKAAADPHAGHGGKAK